MIKLDALKLIVIILLVFVVINIVSADDIDMNYIRGTVYLANGSPAPSGTELLVIITKGKSAGFTFEFSVDDENVPSVLYNRGYYSTSDNINFNTNDSFKIIANDGTHQGSTTGIFVIGGNGAWGTDKVNIIISEPYEPEETQDEIAGIAPSNYTQEEIFPPTVPKNITGIAEMQEEMSENQSTALETAGETAFAATMAASSNMIWFLILIIIIIIIIIICYKSKKRKK
jgi:uncharacterized integral membrane protein